MMYPGVGPEVARLPEAGAGAAARDVEVEHTVEVGEVVLVEEGSGVGRDGGHAPELPGRGGDGPRDEVVAGHSCAAARGGEERAGSFPGPGRCPTGP